MLARVLKMGAEKTFEIISFNPHDPICLHFLQTEISFKGTPSEIPKFSENSVKNVQKQFISGVIDKTATPFPSDTFISASPRYFVS